MFGYGRVLPNPTNEDNHDNASNTVGQEGQMKKLLDVPTRPRTIYVPT